MFIFPEAVAAASGAPSSQPAAPSFLASSSASGASPQRTSEPEKDALILFEVQTIGEISPCESK